MRVLRYPPYILKADLVEAIIVPLHRLFFAYNLHIKVQLDLILILLKAGTQWFLLFNLINLINIK